jgi:hypothetical protein
MLNLLFMKESPMSVLIIGLSIGGIFAGAAGGVATKLLNETGGLAIGLASALTGGSSNTKKSASLTSYILVGALSGGLIGAGAGLATESFNDTANTKITAPAVKSSQNMMATCFANAPEGAQLSLSKDKNGQMQCGVTIPTYN